MSRVPSRSKDLASPHIDAANRAMDLYSEMSNTRLQIAAVLEKEFGHTRLQSLAMVRAAEKALAPRHEKARQRMRARLSARLEKLWQMAIIKKDLQAGVRILDRWAKLFGLDHEAEQRRHGGNAGDVELLTPKVIDVPTTPATAAAGGALSLEEIEELSTLLALAKAQRGLNGEPSDD